MKWINHNIVTFSTVYMFTNDLCAASMSLLGAVFPDFAEGKPCLLYTSPSPRDA